MTPPPLDPGDALASRRQKLAALRDRGVDPYPPRARRTHAAAEVLTAFAALESAATPVAVAGRITALRTHGKATFADVADASGRVQVYFKQDALGRAAYEVVGCLDLGDFIGVEGPVFKTRTGEITVAAAAVTVLAKGLRTPPVVKAEETAAGVIRHDEFADPEKRYRKRHLDMLVNAEARERVLARARVAAAARRFMEGRGFVEIETPVLQPLYGGANARPFTTRHRELGADLYLRIADELYLKRCLVAGMEKVFEIGKDFRNEGIDRIHYPEFTMLEAYEAYGDYETMMALVEELAVAVAMEVFGATTFTYQGKPLSLAPPWPKLAMVPALDERLGFDVLTAPIEKLIEVYEKAILEEELTKLGDNRLPPEITKKIHDLKSRLGVARPQVIDALFDFYIVRGLQGPTFVVDYPAELSPLAKRRRDDERYAERFELFIGRMEIANAFTEQNDPAVQRAAFESQMEARAAGDEESHPVDEDFLEALEYGMPPAGGLGVGLDRLAMVLTDAPNIREVIAFPQVRAKKPAP